MSDPGPRSDWPLFDPVIRTSRLEIRYPESSAPRASCRRLRLFLRGHDVEAMSEAGYFEEPAHG
jgi:hypothetical protein